MSRDKPFIPRENQRHPAQDFSFLRSKGIEYAQALAGQNWTDYNEHDPGVTILEQLAYAITELGYRTNLDIKDLITSQEHLSHEGKSDVSAFFTAFDILTTNPVTVNDLRKLIIDRVREVDNVWILPFNHHRSDSGIKGAYVVLVKIDSTNDYAKETGIKSDIREELFRCRNLGELCQDVIVLQEQELYMRADIELLQNADVERVHAKVIFELQRYISSPIPFYTLNEMMDMSLDTSDIFDGPKLYNGFILDHDLKAKKSVFYSNELINVIRGVEGVKSVKYFKILQERTEANGTVLYDDYFDQLGGRSMGDALIISKDRVAVLGSKILDDANHPAFFSYYRDSMKVSVFQRDVDRCYKELKSNTVFRFRKHFDQAKDLPVPKGVNRNIKDYHSIQHHFPDVYGLGNDGIPSHFSAERRSYVYQLKGYLLLFEQFLSDYLMQLARFNELFSLDEQLDQTYFAQAPWDIPNIYKLLAGMEKHTDPRKIEEGFNEAVKGLAKGIDNFYDRRNRFLDHLFARFGDVDDFLFEQFIYYKDQDAHSREQLINKIRTLKKYPLLTREKSRSFDPRKEYWGKKNYSVIEERVRIQMGIDHDARRIAHLLQSEVAFGLKPGPSGLKDILEIHPALEAEPVETSLTGLAKYKELADTMEPGLIDKISIDEPLLRRGIWEDNLSVLTPYGANGTRHLLLFRINFDTELVDNAAAVTFAEITGVSLKDNTAQQFTLLLRNDDVPEFLLEFENNLQKTTTKVKCAWKVLREYGNETDAFKAAFSLKNKLMRLNRDSEGFYLLDHALLQPKWDEYKCKIQFGNETETLAFQLNDVVSYPGIHNFIVQRIKDLRAGEFKVVKEQNGFVVAARLAGAELGRSLHVFADSAAAEEEVDKLKIYFQQFTDLDIQNEQKVRLDHCRVLPDQQEADYNFTVSVFLSGWTARFYDREFRHQTETLFRKYMPAHMAIQFHWLGLPAMLAFEHLFDVWLTKYRYAEQFHEVSALFNEFDTTQELNRASRDLVDFIKKKFPVRSMADWENFQKLTR